MNVKVKESEWYGKCLERDRGWKRKKKGEGNYPLGAVVSANACVYVCMC